MTAKQRVKRQLRSAFCCRLSDGSGYIVWPAREVGPRGGEMSAIGFGKTAAMAWKSALDCVLN